MESNELMHYGVLGMKWGVRRSRPTSRSSTVTPKRKPVEISDDYRSAHTKKSVKSMSDAELRKRINRIQMEQQYVNLSSNNVSKGKAYVGKIMKAGTTVAAVTSTGLTIYKNSKQIRQIIEPMLKE